MKRVLFVEDNEAILNIYRKVFQNRGDEWQCFFALDITDAFEILAFSKIDIVITDLDMPVYDGVQLLKIVKDKYPAVTRIIFSGSSDIKNNMEAIKYTHRFISKPSTIKDIENVIDKLYKLYRIIIDAKTRSTISAITELPTLPSIYAEVLSELSKENYSLARIGDLINSDVGLSTTILKVINSEYFVLKREISSVKQAVTLLGSEIIKGLILTANVTREATVDEQIFSLENWQTHSLMCGMFCSAIAEYENMSKEDIESAYVCGLLHDVGRIVLALQFPDKYKRSLAISNATMRELDEVEKEVIGASHSAVGAYLLGLWGLPDTVVEAVATHHSPAQYTNIGEKFANILHHADLFTYDLIPSLQGGHSSSRTTIHSDVWDKWRAACSKIALEKGYIEENTSSNSDIEFTSLEDGHLNSDFLHGYDS